MPPTDQRAKQGLLLGYAHLPEPDQSPPITVEREGEPTNRTPAMKQANLHIKRKEGTRHKRCERNNRIDGKRHLTRMLFINVASRENDLIKQAPLGQEKNTSIKPAVTFSERHP